MFDTKYTGIIPEDVLKKQRVDLEPNMVGMFKVLIRSLTSNMTEDELYTDQSTVASVMLLSDVLSKVNITNAVQLIINEDIIFHDLHNKDHDLPQMVDIIEKAKINKLESAEITMERQFDDLHITYHFSISKKSDNTARIEIKINGTVEEQGGSDSQTFYDEVDVLITKLEDLDINFDI